MKLTRPTKLIGTTLVALGLSTAPVGFASAQSPADEPLTPDAELIANSFESDAASWARNMYRPATPAVSDQFTPEPNPSLGMSIPLSERSSLRLGAETENLDLGAPSATNVDTWHFGYRFTWD